MSKTLLMLPQTCTTWTACRLSEMMECGRSTSLMIRAWAVRIHAPTPFPLLFHASSYSSMASSSSKPNRFAMSRSVRIAVVGDVHDDWDLEEDSKALQLLQPDLVLFTGDFGNENVELVRSISNLKFTKAAILGNHDCWYTPQFSEKKVDSVHLQLECLGEQHVGYQRLDFPMLRLSIVGGRPFSCGGDRIFRRSLLSSRYGVNDMEGSAQKIYEAALGTPEDHSIIFLAHNGPTGLGSQVNDICGRDWVFGGGDHGDPDLAQAISDLQRNTQIPIPIVVFGHMHKELAYGNGLRKMIAVGEGNTIYLNGAIVPRVKMVQGGSSSVTKKNKSRLQASDAKDGTLRAFTLVEIMEGRVEKISEIWLLVAGNKTEVKEEIILFSNP